jgi:hypothetical protein
MNARGWAEFSPKDSLTILSKTADTLDIMNNIFHHNGLANVAAQATFPPENPFAHVVNGERNKLLLSLANTGTSNFTLVNAAASYHDPAQNWALVSRLDVDRELR